MPVYILTSLNDNIYDSPKNLVGQNTLRWGVRDNGLYTRKTLTLSFNFATELSHGLAPKLRPDTKRLYSKFFRINLYIVVLPLI